jgi:hypothetical protein
MLLEDKNLSGLLGKLGDLSPSSWQEDIIEKAKKELKGSEIKNINVKNIVDEELQILFRNNYIVISDNKFVYNDEYSIIWIYF